MPRSLLAILAIVLAACRGASQAAAPAPAADDPEVAAAAEALRRGDPETAQEKYLAATARNPANAAAWLGVGDSSSALFTAAVADPRRGNPQLHLQDAERGYARAIEADPDRVSAYVGAARIARELGELEKAGRFAQQAKDRIPKGADATPRFDVLLELGRARSAEFLAALRANASPILQGELYGRAREAFLSASAVLPDRPEATTELAAFEASRRAIDEAIKVLLDAIVRSPEQAAYQRSLCDLCTRSGHLARLGEIYVSKLANLAETSPTTAWFAGYVKICEAEDLRGKQDFDAARLAYEAARKRFASAAAGAPAYAATSRYYDAMAVAGLARILFEQRQLAEASATLTDALKLDLTILERPDSLGVTPKRTSLEIGGEYFKGAELESGAKLFEGWLGLSKDDVDWLNNAGLMRRDLGEELAHAGKDDQARESFEASYRHYKRLAELRPEEPRLVNDAALLLLYHLHRDLDVAERMFRRAIELGEAKLGELGERPEESDDDPQSAAAAREWDYFAEATGDACQNLALLLWEKEGDSAEIRKLIERSLELDPRGTRGFLRARLESLPASGPAPKPTAPMR